MLRCLQVRLALFEVLQVQQRRDGARRQGPARCCSLPQHVLKVPPGHAAAQAILSPELRPGGAPKLKKQREPRGLRRATGRNRGDQYPGKKVAVDRETPAGYYKWRLSLRVAGPQEASPGRWRVRIGQNPKTKKPKQTKQPKQRRPAPGPLPAEPAPAPGSRPRPGSRVTIRQAGSLSRRGLVDEFLKRNRPLLLDGPLPSSWTVVENWVTADGGVDFDGMLASEGLADAVVPVDLCSHQNGDGGYGVAERVRVMGSHVHARAVRKMTPPPPLVGSGGDAATGVCRVVAQVNTLVPAVGAINSQN